MHSFTAAEDSEQVRFVAAFDCASGELLRHLRLGPFLVLYVNGDFNKAGKTAHSFVDSIVVRALADGEKGDMNGSGDGEGKGHHRFLQGLLDSVTNPQRLRSEMVNILQAGRDTTAGLPSHVFHTRARRKDV